VLLQDHFRPPLSLRRHWHSFHSAWCTYLSSQLNDQLPEGYFAEPNVQFGIEIDVAAFEDEAGAQPTLLAAWSSPPTQTLPITMLSDIVEVLVYDRAGGPTLAGAIELISPANKDRPANRDALVSKCAAYVQQGVGLVLVDVVTDRHANLHDELLDRLHAAADVPLAGDLYATAYRCIKHEEQPNVEVWQESLSVGKVLPSLPLWLRGNLCLRVDLAASYERTCREQRILAAGA
jgi:hypothetical protein